ncbi:hypothetical protein [Acinetobacter lwoffii]|uniref:hypothetical protein n=1 Tax=Acinetobacter lwoffii TaxID=28090 RepID=UPI001444375B|nr:hypothetical protein [Acinetobacter lwoffii]NKS46122.1 hypothetical protein [Acinetobacter lwoffii]
MHPDELFELFYQDITPEMNPPGMPKYHSEGMYMWWRELFMNAYFGHQEPYALRSWAEAPQMWLKGYNRGLKENN